MEHRRAWFHLTRDLGMFLLGAGLLAYEAIIGSDRSNLIYAGVALMSLGAFGRAFAVRNGEKL